MSSAEKNLEWARRLGCPSSALTDPVNKLLNEGISSLLWEKLATTLHPTKECLDARKNILLHKLKQRENDVQIQQVESRARLKSERKLLEPRFESLEKECEQKEFRVRQKQQQLLKLKALRQSIKTKENLLRKKLNETRAQVEDCKEMRSVCQHLMPAASCEIDPKIVDESLSLVSAISTRTDRKKVWNEISEKLNPVEIPTLWNILLMRVTSDTEELMGLGTREIPETRGESGENMDIGIARACGRYVATATQGRIHRAKATEHEQSVMEYIEKIETSKTNAVDVSEWLALTLEVCKLETEQKTLQSEIEAAKKTLEQQGPLAEELSSLEYDVHSIDTQVENCVQDVQKSLALLKPAGSLIDRTRQKLMAVLQKILALRSESETTDYLDVDLSTELGIFHENLQLEALRKILLKDKVGAYRHAKCCMSEAALAIAPPSLSNCPSQFPMIRAPIHQLLECYKHLAARSWLMKLENQFSGNERPLLEGLSFPVPTDPSGDTLEVLNATDLTCDRVREEIRQFDLIFDAWTNQTVRKAMALDESIVNGATFKEWVKRYDNLLHMIHRTGQPTIQVYKNS